MCSVFVEYRWEQAAWLGEGPPTGFGRRPRRPPFGHVLATVRPQFARIAERHRSCLIIDHMGVSSDAAAKKAVPAAIDQSAALAKYPNVSVKLSAAPLFSSEPYPFRDVTPHIRRLFEAYGPRRCYWGTDMTNSFAKATYRQRITHFTEELDFLSEDDKDWIMGRALVTRLGWT